MNSVMRVNIGMCSSDQTPRSQVPPAGLDGGGFCYHKPGAANGPRPQVNQMPIRRESVLCPILAHW